MLNEILWHWTETTLHSRSSGSRGKAPKLKRPREPKVSLLRAPAAAAEGAGNSQARRGPGFDNSRVGWGGVKLAFCSRLQLRHQLPVLQRSRGDRGGLITTVSEQCLWSKQLHVEWEGEDSANDHCRNNYFSCILKILSFKLKMIQTLYN